ncbi:glycosyltransferase family 4 protein [candidate division KSB1 bacterium]|nr:glycosyltransferase family 4 protein [candidate division KSB1 bacterium]
MPKHKIAHIQVLPIMSGVQKAMVDILTRLDPDIYEIHVICHAEGALTETLKKYNIRCIVINELRREIHPIFDLLAVLKLYRLFKKEQYNLVHTHSSKPGIVGRLAAKLAGVRCIVHTVQGFAFHEQSSKLTRFIVGCLEKCAGFLSDRVIFVNDKDRHVAEQMKLMPKEKMVTIYNGIDVNHTRSELNIGLEKLIGIKKNGALVGMVSRLWKQKAPHDFIRAIPYVTSELPAAKFLMIGDGPLKDELIELSETLGVSDAVQFLGWREDVFELINQLDVMVLTSLWEGLPLTILEGMALAKPVVATDIKGNNELVIHGETGFLAPPGDYQKIGEYSLKLLDDKELARRMGEAGRQRVSDKFSIEKTIKSINTVYGNLLDG